MKTLYFHRQYKTNGLETNEISYIFDLRHLSKIAANFQRKTECSYIYSRIQAKKLKKY